MHKYEWRIISNVKYLYIMVVFMLILIISLLKSFVYYIKKLHISIKVAYIYI